MNTYEFMSIAPMFASEDKTRPAICASFRHGNNLFVTDGRIALVADARRLDADRIMTTGNKQQKNIGDKVLDYIRVIKSDIERHAYCGYGLCSIREAVCAVVADLEPDMMVLRANECDDDDPGDFGLPDSVRFIHDKFSMVIMANPARSVISGYYASLIVGLMKHFGPVAAYADSRNPHKPLYFQGDDWHCVLMPRRVDGFGVCFGWDYCGCAVADAATGDIVWRRGKAGAPDLVELRRGAANRELEAVREVIK